MSRSESTPQTSLRAVLRARAGLLIAWARSEAHDSLAQRMAGTAFLIRLASAAFLYLSQILFARWMGGAQFGLYIYVWTWAILFGDLIHLGLASVAPRFIPQYTQEGREDLLRGFILGSCTIVFSSACIAGIVAAAVVWLIAPVLDPAEIVPLYLVCLVLPAYALSIMLDGIARSYNWVGLALLPPYVLRPALLIVFMAAAHQFGVAIDAVTVLIGANAATWLGLIVQIGGLARLLRRTVPSGVRQYAPLVWLSTALPVLMVIGFYTLLTYIDIIVLRQFRPAEEVAIYYAATKTMALVAMIYFSVGTAVAHRFTEYHFAGERDRLAAFVTASVRWTFWPSLAAIAILVALGWPILWLFGPEFVSGYPVMFILGLGLLARASVGTAERLLSMVNQQRACAVVYAVAFAINLTLCFVLIPRWGMFGAAVSTASALIAESVMLYMLVRRRVGLHSFVFFSDGKPLRAAA
jgi:O-antigen/teichoic acid export membrane protein